MLKCREVVAQASEYIDGELTPLGRWRYRLHLLLCGHCRRFITQFRQGIRMIRQRHRGRARSAPVEGVLRRIQAEKGPSS